MRAGILLALLLGACAPTQAARVPAPQGPTLVSLNPCTDAILAEVADPAQILAISAWSHDPASSSMDTAQARRFASTNGSVEEVLALKPDLVIDGNFTPPATRAAFGKLGLRLEAFPIASTVEASRAQVRQLAALAGHPERGEAMIRRIDA
ncbi:MAG: ABC transporter substrate-binding protein, partial [Novosphingobium sp.]